MAGRSPKRLRQWQITGVVGIVSALVITLVVWSCWSSTIILNGAHKTIIPVPYPAFRITSTDTALSLITFRACDLAGVFANEQMQTDWQMEEQMGSAYRLSSPRGTLNVVTRRWYSLFTRLDYYLDLTTSEGK